MTATYTFDVFTSLDGYGDGERRLGRLLGQARPRAARPPPRLVRRGAAHGLRGQHVSGSSRGCWPRAPRSPRCRPMGHPDEEPAGDGGVDDAGRTPRLAGRDLVSGDAVDVVARLKEESAVPLRSHGSLSLNRALMAAGLVDRVQVTLFPVITGQTGQEPIFGGAADFDLELVEQPDARRSHPGADLPTHPPLTSSRKMSGPRPTTPARPRVRGPSAAAPGRRRWRLRAGRAAAGRGRGCQRHDAVDGALDHRRGAAVDEGSWRDPRANP